jgi:hypothetical protein
MATSWESVATNIVGIHDWSPHGSPTDIIPDVRSVALLAGFCDTQLRSPTRNGTVSGVPIAGSDLRPDPKFRLLPTQPKPKV